MAEATGSDLLGISEVKKVKTEEQANKHLADGWVLLSVLNQRDGNLEYVEYILGYPEEPAAPNFG